MGSLFNPGTQEAQGSWRDPSSQSHQGLPLGTHSHFFSCSGEREETENL